jgi:transposase-like protein
MEMPRQQYSRELKIATVRELDAGKSMAHLAPEYLLSPKRLEVWQGEWRAKGELAFLVRVGPQAKSDAERMAQLERKIGELSCLSSLSAIDGSELIIRRS